MRKVRLKAGKRTKVLGLMTRNLGAHVEFEIASDDGAPSRGTVETSHCELLSARETEVHPLHPLNTFNKPASQHGYRIHITSETDATLTFRTRHIRDIHIYGAMIGMAVLGAGASLVMMMLR